MINRIQDCELKFTYHQQAKNLIISNIASAVFYLLMYSITLKFQNKELESKYEACYLLEQMQTIQDYLKQYIVLCVISIIAFYIEGLYYSSVWFAIAFIGSASFFGIYKKVPAKLTIAFFNFYLIFAVVAYWLAFALDSQQASEFLVHYILFIIFCGATFIFTENIPLALFQLCFYVASCAFILDYYSKVSVLQMIWLPIVFIWFYQFHNKIKRKRQLFQQSQVNQSIYELIQQTTNDDFFLFSYDDEQQNYCLTLTNKQEFKINHFLKNFLHGSMTLSTYLHSEFIQKNQSKTIREINGFYSNGKNPQKYYIYVQTYPKLMFYMRLIPPTYKPKEMFIYHYQVVNHFFSAIDRIRKNGSIRTYYLMQLINELKYKFPLQTISYSHELFAHDHQLINLNQLLRAICINQGLNGIIGGQCYVKINYKVIQIYLSSIVTIIRRYNHQVQIDLSADDISTQVNFKFQRLIDVDKIEQTQYFKCLQKINSIISLVAINLQQNSFLINLISNQELPFTDTFNEIV